MRLGRRQESTAEVLFDPAKVDSVALSPDGGRVRLYIVSDAAWTGSDAQITSLQEKIHNYVGFALDGQLAADYPDAAGLPWEIVIDCQRGAPDARTADVLARVGEAVRRHTGELIVLTPR